MNLKKEIWIQTDPAPRGILLKSALVALFLEVVSLTAIGWHEHWLSHPQKTTGLDESRFIETEVFQFPEEAHLVEEKKVSAPAPKTEATISTQVSAKPNANTTQITNEENITESGPKIAPNHGPIAIYAPPPILPSYLQDQDLKTNVLIDFYVTAQGAVTPKLVGSSGNEELDAIALEAVSKWQFRPGEKDHHPIDAKVRLRIIFEVK